MDAGRPSETALRVAAHRAAHQVLERGAVFTDPYAAEVLGGDAEALIAAAASDATMRPMRLMFAARSRFAEDCLHDAVARGTRQIVILGAGLDTFALRNPYRECGVEVYEVDHPATQRWKQQRLSEMGLPPSPAHYVPLDFERSTLGAALSGAGLDASRPVFLHWLGVITYLERHTVFDALHFVASLPNPEIVFDYTEPIENYAPKRRDFMRKVAERAAQAGEAWLTFFDPSDLSRQLLALDFGEQEDLGFADLQARYGVGSSSLQISDGAGPHIIRARKTKIG